MNLLVDPLTPNLSLALSYKEREPEYICYVEKASISPFPRREGGWGVRFFQFASSILAGKGAGGLGFPSSPAVSYVFPTASLSTNTPVVARLTQFGVRQ